MEDFEIEVTAWATQIFRINADSQEDACSQAEEKMRDILQFNHHDLDWNFEFDSDDEDWEEIDEDIQDYHGGESEIDWEAYNERFENEED